MAFFSSKKNSSPVIDSRLKSAFNAIKEEFSEHLDAINENTSEIQSNYELMLRIESRLEKIESRLNDVELFLRHNYQRQIKYLSDDAVSFIILPLDVNEKLVFRAIYESQDQGQKPSYAVLAESLEMSVSSVRELVTRLIEKGVPIIKHYVNQSVLLSIDSNFKEIQTKKNIIQL